MNRDEVISGLEKCAASECNEKCPYNGINYGCRPRLMLDAVELLKEQEQKINSLEEQLRLLEYGDQETQNSALMPAT